jgi:hypothetical protein
VVEKKQTETNLIIIETDTRTGTISLPLSLILTDKNLLYFETDTQANINLFHIRADKHIVLKSVIDSCRFEE